MVDTSASPRVSVLASQPREPPLDETAYFEALLQRLRRRCGRVCSRFRIPLHERDDVLQDCLLAYYARRAEVVNPDAFLYEAFRNRCIDYHRRRCRHFEVSFEEAVLAALADPQEPAVFQLLLRRDLARALAAIPQRCRDLLTARFAEELSAAETAGRMGYRPNSMKKTTTRCLRAMREALLALWAVSNDGTIAAIPAGVESVAKESQAKSPDGSQRPFMARTRLAPP